MKYKLVREGMLAFLLLFLVIPFSFASLNYQSDDSVHIPSKVIVVLKEGATIDDLELNRVSEIESSEKQTASRNYASRAVTQQVTFDSTDDHFKVIRTFGGANAFAAEITPTTFLALEQSSDVEKIYNADEFKFMAMLQDSADLINATQVYTIQVNSTNITGKNQVVCIADTGIDYTHPDFWGEYLNHSITDAFDLTRIMQNSGFNIVSDTIITSYADSDYLLANISFSNNIFYLNSLISKNYFTDFEQTQLLQNESEFESYANITINNGTVSVENKTDAYFLVKLNHSSGYVGDVVLSWQEAKDNMTIEAFVSLDNKTSWQQVTNSEVISSGQTNENYTQMYYLFNFTLTNVTGYANVSNVIINYTLYSIVSEPVVEFSVDGQEWINDSALETYWPPYYNNSILYYRVNLTDVLNNVTINISSIETKTVLNPKIIGGYDFVNNDADVFDDTVSSKESHGTHVAGIIAANGKIKGIAPDAKLVIVKVLDSVGFDTGGNITSGIEYCANYSDTFGTEINAISVSIGTYSYHSSTYCDGDFPDMSAAIETAVLKNISVIVATGNENTIGAISSPACFENVTRVGATDKSYNIESYTNRGDYFDIYLAPGSSINSTVKTASYAEKSGTSMATPHVSAVIALLSQYLQETGIDSLTPKEFRTLLDGSGMKIYDSPSNGTYTFVDAYQAIEDLKVSFSVENTGYYFEKGEILNFSISSDFFNISDVFYENSSSNVSLPKYSEEMKWYLNTSGWSVGEHNISLFINTTDDQIFERQYSFGIDTKPNITWWSIRTRNESGQDAVFNVSQPNNYQIYAYEKNRSIENFWAYVSANDSESDSITYFWKVSPQISGSDYLNYNGTDFIQNISGWFQSHDAGTYTLELIASDNKLNSSINFNLTVIDPYPPSISTIQNFEDLEEGDVFTLNVTPFVTNPDNDALTYSLSSDATNDGFVINSKGILSYDDGAFDCGDADNYYIIVYVSDGTTTVSSNEFKLVVAVSESCVEEQQEQEQNSQEDELLSQNNIPGISVTKIFSIVRKDTDTAFSISKKEVPVSMLMFNTFRELTNLKIIVRSFNIRPSTISPAPGSVYKYFAIDEINLNNSLRKAEITIRVSKKWIDNEEIIHNSISLLHYDIDTDLWQKLPTEFKRTDDEFFYYEAETNSFSYFAITGTSVKADPKNKPTETPKAGLLTSPKNNSNAVTGRLVSSDESIFKKSVEFFEDNLFAFIIISSTLAIIVLIALFKTDILLSIYKDKVTPHKKMRTKEKPPKSHAKIHRHVRSFTKQKKKKRLTADYLFEFLKMFRTRRSLAKVSKRLKARQRDLEKIKRRYQN